ncbi:MAG TPA: hypothetical protein VF646_12745, partial [Cytophagales bacterium]
MNDTAQLLKICLQRMEEKLQWGSSREWVNAHFIHLSEKITAASRISISPHTLKRLFGKIKYKEAHNPQIETKNALAIFLGYRDWEEFARYETGPAPLDTPGRHAAGEEAAAGRIPSSAFPAVAAGAPAADRPPVGVRAAYDAGRRPDPRRRAGRAVLWLGLLGLLAWASVLARRGPHSPVAPPVSFRGKHLRGFPPLTAVFNYDVSTLPSDSVSIYFEGYNAGRPLPRDKRTITQWYEFPGYYKVQLLARNRVLASLGVHALSHGWKRIAATEDFSQLYHITTPPAAPGGYLYVSPADLLASRVDTGQRYWVMFRNAQDYQASGDDFAFEARVMNNSGRSSTQCNDVALNLTGAHHAIRIHFLKPGCSRWTNLQAGEVTLNGEFNDLSVFGRDLSGWRTIRLEVKNRTVRVFFEGKLLYRLPYTEPVGPLKSISCDFMRCGRVDYVKLYNGRRELVYADGFDEPV